MRMIVKTADDSGEKYTTWQLTEQERQQVRDLFCEHDIPETKIDYFLHWFEGICRRHKEYQKNNDNITKVKKNRKKLSALINKLMDLFTPPFFLAEDKGTSYGDATKEYNSIEFQIYKHYVDALEQHIAPMVQLLRRLDAIEKEHRQPKSNTTEFVFEVARYYKYCLDQAPAETKDGAFFNLIKMAYSFVGFRDKDMESIHPDKATEAALKKLSKHKGI